MKNQPAVPPGLTYHYNTPTLRIPSYADFCSRRVMLRRTYSGIRTPFLIALESPFSPMFFAVISPSTTLWRKINMTYLLFLIGFVLLYAHEKGMSIQQLKKTMSKK